MSAAETASGALDFAHQIVPILQTHCAECHAGDKKKGGFSINTRETFLAGGENGPVVEEGQVGGLLLELIASDDKDVQMPPKGARVSPDDQAKIRA